MTAPIQRHKIANPMPTTAGGAYHSARIVTQCECRSYQISFLPELHGGTSPASPALFSPQSFLLREKRLGRRRHVGSDLGGTSRRCARCLLSSARTSSFPNRKRFAGLRFGVAGGNEIYFDIMITQSDNIEIKACAGQKILVSYNHSS